MNYRILFFLVGISLFSLNGNAQISELTKNPNVVQLSGVIVTGDSLRPVPFSTVYRKNDTQGTHRPIWVLFATGFKW
jgi:hypothetical protein